MTFVDIMTRYPSVFSHLDLRALKICSKHGVWIKRNASSFGSAIARLLPERFLTKQLKVSSSRRGGSWVALL
jgi:hypothetical protein